MKWLKYFLSRLHNSWRTLPVVQVQLINTGERTFVDPNPNYRANILNDLGQEVGFATFGVSPLGDTIYVYSIDVYPQHRRQGYALAFLCWLYKPRLPITPIHIVGNAIEFWYAARAFPRRLLIVKDEVRAGEMVAEKSRWAHLIPDPEHIRLQ